VNEWNSGNYTSVSDLDTVPISSAGWLCIIQHHGIFLRNSFGNLKEIHINAGYYFSIIFPIEDQQGNKIENHFGFV